MTVPERPATPPPGSSPRRRGIELSVLVPVKDEAESIPLLSAEIERELDRLGRAWECLWVDDGSRDGSTELLRALHAARPEHQLIRFDRNYGQSAALGYAFHAAAGRVLITLDADLQNDPADIGRLLEHLESRPELGMVNGVRRRRHDGLVRRISSRIANGFRNWLTGEAVSDVGCSLRVCYRDCVQAIPPFRGMHRFIPTFARMRGYRIAELPVGHRARRFGEAKYGVHNRLWVGLLDTFGVRWLQRRHVAPRVAETTLASTTPAAPARSRPTAAPAATPAGVRDSD
jgi:glycosyltransferase involved in cell wall biosynthesis